MFLKSKAEKFVFSHKKGTVQVPTIKSYLRCITNLPQMRPPVGKKEKALHHGRVLFSLLLKVQHLEMVFKAIDYFQMFSLLTWNSLGCKL